MERHHSERLATRRRKRRQRLFVLFIVLLLLIVCGLLYGLQQSAVRISHIEVTGADNSIIDLAQGAMQGRYLGIIPRDSIFFYPESDIRKSILTTHREVATVSLKLDGLQGLMITMTQRVPIARWCGSTPAQTIATTTASTEDCYVFDDSGFVFATTSSLQLINPFLVYMPLASSSQTIGATLPNNEVLPASFNFARQIGTLGSTVSKVAIRDSEVDDYLENGTRITYVLGHEQAAYAALISAKPTLDLQGGSLDYIDLRFDGKVYLKKKNASVPQ